MNSRFLIPSQLAAVLFAMFLAVLAAAPRLSAAQEPAVPVDEIVRKFAEKEKQFQAARANYSYRQDVRVQEIDSRGGVAGEYRRVTDILFDDKGMRIEKITLAPQTTLRGLDVSQEDEDDIRSIQPFVLTTDDIAKYNLRYEGREKIDEIGCYVFDVRPKKLEKNQRYFEGKIWVDDLDLQIVKTFGKAVPDIRGKRENLFPKFETYREQIDDYWFPTYTRADDTLNFSTGPIHIRQTIRYQNYKRFGSDVSITIKGAPGEAKKPVEAPKK